VNNLNGESSHVKLLQTSTTEKNPGEIIYSLSGQSDNGEFYLTGEYKATLQLNGLTLANPDSSAVHIKDGKRIKVSMAANTVNTLSDGVADSTSKGCFHCKGHTEFAGKGTLNVSSSFSHAIYSKEYVEVKNCTLNITSAKKDGIHCQEYFLMNSGTLTITKAPLTITAKSFTIKQGEALPTFEATYEGFKNNETSQVLTKQPAITTTATSSNEPGEYDITISGAEAQNYDISYSKGKLTIEAVEITPITETEEIFFREQITTDADLENVVIDNIYYNVKSANGDGYNATEQALVLNSTTSSTQMSAVQGAQVGDAAVRENFSGIIFEIPAGKGVVTVDAKTIGTHVLNVQIGNGAPTQVKKSERGTVEVEYNVSAPTYVYLYASTESGASARLYRGPSAGANSVLLYGYKVQVGGTGIEELKNGKMEELKYYDLNGRKVKTPRKGVYIINGKKVVVK